MLLVVRSWITCIQQKILLSANNLISNIATLTLKKTFTIRNISFSKKAKIVIVAK